mgnify:CR=1 FL=1
MAIGFLEKPKLPGIPGIETFEGCAFHTARWDYDYTGGDANGNLSKLRDKTVGIIGTGATAVQCVPHLGASAKQVTSRYDGTALIAAAHLGHDGVVRQLIAAGAPLDHVNNLHWTAVIESIVLGDGGPRHQATLKALIDAGASLKLADRSGRTPLALARSRGYSAMVKMLEQAGAP